MVLQIVWVAMVKIKVFYETSMARPEVYLVLGVTEVVGETAPKIACSEHKNTRSGGGRRGHGTQAYAGSSVDRTFIIGNQSRDQK